MRAAYDLAEHVKGKVSRSENYFEYLVLESIDYPTQSIETFWDLRYGKDVKKCCTSLTPCCDADWRDISNYLEDWMNDLPRGAILNVGQQWLDYWRDGGTDAAPLTQRIERLYEVIGPKGRDLLFTKIMPLLTSPVPDSTAATQQYNPGWIHLTELWDYLAPTNRKGGQ